VRLVCEDLRGPPARPSVRRFDDPSAAIPGV
jgi:hypothetical protein